MKRNRSWSRSKLEQRLLVCPPDLNSPPSLRLYTYSTARVVLVTFTSWCDEGWWLSTATKNGVENPKIITRAMPWLSHLYHQAMVNGSLCQTMMSWAGFSLVTSAERLCIPVLILWTVLSWLLLILHISNWTPKTKEFPTVFLSKTKMHP